MTDHNIFDEMHKESFARDAAEYRRKAQVLRDQVEMCDIEIQFLKNDQANSEYDREIRMLQKKSEAHALAAQEYDNMAEQAEQVGSN